MEHGRAYRDQFGNADDQIEIVATNLDRKLSQNIERLCPVKGATTTLGRSPAWCDWRTTT